MYIGSPSSPGSVFKISILNEMKRSLTKVMFFPLITARRSFNFRDKQKTYPVISDNTRFQLKPSKSLAVSTPTLANKLPTTSCKAGNISYIDNNARKRLLWCNHNEEKIRVYSSDSGRTFSIEVNTFTFSVLTYSDVVSITLL